MNQQIRETLDTTGDDLKAAREKEQQEARAEVDQLREQWLASKFTNELLQALHQQEYTLLHQASANAYNGNDNNKQLLVKAETIRKVVKYARSGTTDW